MAGEHYIRRNLASKLELPRTGYRLPRAVLTAEEAESILSQPNIADPTGVRIRAIPETF
jgi:integrase/recombinase XerD